MDAIGLTGIAYRSHDNACVLVTNGFKLGYGLIDEDAKANVPRDLPSYPFQVHVMPSPESIAAWHKFEADEEARQNKKAA